MEFVDTHCHLNFHAFENDLDQVIERATLAGVKQLIVPGLDFASSRQAVDLAEKYPQVYAAIGVHPEEVAGYNKGQYTLFEGLLSHEKVVAVGEIGLDYYHRQDQNELQRQILKLFLNLAAKHNKPVILHSRESLTDLINIVQEVVINSKDYCISGIFHAFEGNYQDATRVAKLGFYIGAGGPITYKNAHIKHEVFSKINLEKIVLETDAPFLAPQNFRGKRNEPSYIPLIAERLAEIQQCDIKEVASITTLNAKTLFNWN